MCPVLNLIYKCRSKIVWGQKYPTGLSAPTKRSSTSRREVVRLFRLPSSQRLVTSCSSSATQKVDHNHDDNQHQQCHTHCNGNCIVFGVSRTGVSWKTYINLYFIMQTLRTVLYGQCLKTLEHLKGEDGEKGNNSHRVGNVLIL